MIRFTELDVRPILSRGDEPIVTIREMVAALGAGEGLTVVAPFIPYPLIEFLKSEGFASSLERRKAGAWAVSFWREDTASP